METIHTGDISPFSSRPQEDTIDLSDKLEHQLDQQMASDSRSYSIPRQELSPEEESFEEEHPEEESFQEPPHDTARDKTVTLIDESKYLRYISDLRKADSELALAKAESAELVRQIDNYRAHYTEYEKKIHGLVLEQDQSLEKHLDVLTDLARSIKDSSDSLSSRIDGEIQRLTQALSEAIHKDIKASCDEELAHVSEATDVLFSYTEKVKNQHVRFQKLERFKFALFIASSLSAPAVLVLFILNLLHVF